MENEICYIGESEAEREAYDLLEALARKWEARAAAEHEPFDLTRTAIKSKVAPVCKRRAPIEPKSFLSRLADSVNNLFWSICT